jgi:exosome complex component RRP43
MCSPKFKPGPPTEEAQVLSERLNQALVACVSSPSLVCPSSPLTDSALSSSDFLPPSTLCIHPGKTVWVLYVDATCINYNGNAFDAALLAMVAALRNSVYLFLYVRAGF